MFRYIAGLLTAFLFIGSVCGFLYILDQYNYVDLKPSVLFALSTIPGWEEVYECYELGSEKRELLIDQEQVLTAREKELEARKQALAEQELALQEQEYLLERERERILTELARLERNQTQSASTINPTDKHAAAARLLESMNAIRAGENLLTMPFDMGVSVLSLIEPRRAAKILESLPPEESSRYLEAMTKK